MYYKLMELHTDAQLLKIVPISGSSYLRLIKEIEFIFLMGCKVLNYKLIVGKYISDIVSDICIPVIEYDLVFDEEMSEFFRLNLLLLPLLFWCVEGVVFVTTIY